MAEKSRAEYFRKRRQELKQAVIMVEKEKVQRLDDKLRQQGENRTTWLRRKIDEEISK